ncbi:hypothetical protein Dda_5818 [Drechslerella dactyloides]|uniref:Uncharacterized protein n=1 Tax=Drechslerella dactyloides TaxID=74499 RepID=A0AAD6NJD8_DREDA|nr:hypothetical protein Dda_5818 [Drechslerella dactyloides]
MKSRLFPVEDLQMPAQTVHCPEMLKTGKPNFGSRRNADVLVERPDAASSRKLVREKSIQYSKTPMPASSSPLFLPLALLFLLILSNPLPIFAVFTTHAAKKKPPKPRNIFSRVLPLLILLAVLAVIGAIVYLTWVTVCSFSTGVRNRLDDKNIKLHRNGADVSVKGVTYEKYRDLTQKVVVDAWNTSETKGYKSRLWSTSSSKKEKKDKKDKKNEKRRSPTSGGEDMNIFLSVDV